MTAALTPKGYLRKINVNGAWEYFKAKERKLLSTSQTKKIYARRKIDVESVFGHMKTYLGFKRFSVRGLDKVTKEIGIVIMAINIRKLMARSAIFKFLCQTKRTNHKIVFDFRLVRLV